MSYLKPVKMLKGPTVFCCVLKAKNRGILELEAGAQSLSRAVIESLTRLLGFSLKSFREELPRVALIKLICSKRRVNLSTGIETDSKLSLKQLFQ